MSRLPPMGEHEELRLRAEMADWEDARLIAKVAKAPGLAAGIAAQQILDERNRSSATERHAELLDEVRTPHWSITPSFVLLVITSVLSLVAVVLAALALPQVQQSLWPASSTQASSPGHQPVTEKSKQESSNSRTAAQGITIASAPASSPAK